MKKPTVAVFFGSRSTEHDISILTALASVIKPLELSKKFNVIPVYIAKDGRWYSHPQLAEIALYQSGELQAFLSKQKPIGMLFENGLTLVKSGLRNQHIKIDVAFPATHGTHGEDGELMGLFEMANVPYVGCGVSASVVAMDKVLAKQVAEANGIATSPFVAFYEREYEANPEAWLKKIGQLNFPLFVKPAHLGSSIAISRVTNATELANAIEVALHYDDKALAEEAIQNLTEVTLPIIGNDEPTPAFLEEPFQGEDFFDFDTKYMKGGKKGGVKTDQQSAQGYSRIPAELSKDLYKKAEEMGLAVYRALNCSGLARVDMLIDSKTQKVYFNEVNPLPGSLYAHNWAKKGLSNVALVTRLVELAMERHHKRQRFVTSFDSSFLNQF